MSASPLIKAHLYEQVADLMEEEIMTLDSVSGRLPSEQELSEKFDVSRSIIREAMKLLKERGLINSRTGSGAYITTPKASLLSATMARIIKINKIDFNDIYRIRILLEVESVRNCAMNATDQALDSMEVLLNTLKNKELTIPDRRDSDYAFHYQIAVASGNGLMALLVKTMSNVFKEMINTGIFIEGQIDDAILRHEKIMIALRNRDPVEAQNAMREHLEQSHMNVANYQKRIKRGTPRKKLTKSE